jgi:hypothetical protein
MTGWVFFDVRLAEIGFDLYVMPSFIHCIFVILPRTEAGKHVTFGVVMGQS